MLLSGLFPTQPGIYRRLGYGLVTSFDTVAVPTQVLAQVPRPDGAIVRRGVEVDAPAVLAVYETWARAQNGALSRRGGSYTRILDELRSASVAVTVAERDHVVIGFACWERGQHYGAKAALEVTSLHASDPEAMAALVHTLGSFASAVPVVNLPTSGDDLSRLLLRAADWQVVGTHPYMIKVLDVAGVLSALSYPTGVTTKIEFAVAGDSMDENNGDYRLVVEGGRGICERLAEVADGPGPFASRSRGDGSRRPVLRKRPVRRSHHGAPRFGHSPGCLVWRPAVPHSGLLLIDARVVHQMASRWHSHAPKVTPWPP